MFSFKRFSEQFKIILSLNAQKQGLNLIVIALVFILCHFFLFYQNGNKLILDFTFWGFIVAIMTIINSTGVFSALLRNESAINYYMTPASIGEKYAAAWLYSSIFTIAVYTSFIYLIHVAAMSLGNMITDRSLPYLFTNNETFKMGLFCIISLQSMFFLGAVVFKKNPFGKTLLTIIVANFMISVIAAVVFNLIYKNGEMFNSSQVMSQNWNIQYESINGQQIPKDWEDPIKALKIFAGSIPFICWIAAYFRLKTREV